MRDGSGFALFICSVMSCRDIRAVTWEVFGAPGHFSWQRFARRISSAVNTADPLIDDVHLSNAPLSS